MISFYKSKLKDTWIFVLIFWLKVDMFIVSVQTKIQFYCINQNGELILIVKVLLCLLLMKMSIESITLTSSSNHWIEKQKVNIFFDNIGYRSIDKINLTIISFSTSSDTHSKNLMFNENMASLPYFLLSTFSFIYKFDILLTCNFFVSYNSL
uniref:Transmembrane protein n=1 Tax=Lepeophtheirus salmonis TaxID=72036 RepID=A0A0K2UK50_LEPSM